MKELSDVIGWIVGFLGALVFLFMRSERATYKADRKSDNEKFKAVFDKQRELSERVASNEATLAGVQVHFMQTLEDIKAQNIEIARDMTEIKVALARIPKRKEEVENEYQ